MAEWLNKEELLNYLEPLTNTPGIVIKRHIKEMKGVKIKPAYYAEWELFWQNGKHKLKCTNCHTLFDIRTNDKHICIYPKFCEECGADMRNKEGGEMETDKWINAKEQQPESYEEVIVLFEYYFCGGNTTKLKIGTAYYVKGSDKWLGDDLYVLPNTNVIYWQPKC